MNNGILLENFLLDYVALLQQASSTQCPDSQIATNPLQNLPLRQINIS